MINGHKLARANFRPMHHSINSNASKAILKLLRLLSLGPNEWKRRMKFNLICDWVLLSCSALRNEPKTELD